MTNPGRPIRPQDLYSAQALWLLEVEWAGRQYRWATALPDGVPVVITTADGVDMEYRGGPAISWRDDFALFDESAAPPVISLDLQFDAIDDVPQRVADGDDLSAMTLSLYRWAPGIAYEDRRDVFFGLSQEPLYGGINEPVTTTFESPLYRGGGVWPAGRVEAGQIGVDAALAKGQAYPIIFGAPSYAASPDSGAAGSPAYPLVAANKTLLAGTWLGDAASLTALWSISRDTTETTSGGAQEPDSLGRSVYVVTSTDVLFDAEDDYAIEWSGDDIGAGELLELCARASTLRVDHSRMAVTRARLDEFKFSGYIDTEVGDSFQWALRHILPLLPASAYHTPEGLAIRVWDDTATADDAIAALDTTNGLVRVGRVQYENAEILNEVTVRYEPDFKGKYQSTRTVTGRLNLGSAPEVIVSPYARASVSRVAILDAPGPLQGVRSKVIETPFVYDDATALRIAMWQVRARGSRRRVVTYLDTQGHLEWLEVGDHVTLTDAELALSSQFAMVRSRRWGADGGFFLDLVLIDDILAR